MKMRITIRITMTMIVTKMIVVMRTSFLQKLRLVLQQIMLVFHARMIKANSGRSPLFVEGSIATLKIPPKLRLKTEGVRLPVRVLEYKNGQYKLQSRHGRLAGRYQG